MTQPSGGTGGTGGTGAGRQPEKWEYFLYETSRQKLLGSGSHLNTYGAGGWEAVSMTQDPEDGSFAILLKRRLVE